MASSKGDVTLKLAVDNSGVAPALAQVEPQLRKLGDGAHSAGGGFGHLADALRDYRQDEVQQARSTRFFAKELASLLPVTDGVAGAFGKLAGALAGGFGIGLAFEGVKLGVEYFTELIRAEEEAAKKAQESADKVYEAWLDASQKLSRLQFIQAGGSPAVVDAVLGSNKAEADYRKKFAAAFAELDRLQKRLKDFQNAKGETIEPDAESAQGKELARIREQIAAYEYLGKTIEAIRKAGSIEVETAIGGIKPAPKAKTGALAPFGQGFDEWLPKPADFNLSPDAYLAPMGAEGNAGLGLGFAMRRQDERFARRMAGAGDETKNETVTKDILGDADRFNKELKAREDQVKNFTDHTKKLMTNGLADTLVNIFDGDFQHIGDMWADLLKRMAAQMIASGFINLITGGTGGFLGGMFSAFGGKRAAGGSVVAGKTYLVGEQGPELFTAQSAGRIIPNNALAAGGGTTVHLNVQGVVDGDHFFATLTRNKTALMRTLREIASDGR